TTVSIPIGQTSANVNVPILDDNQVGETSPETVNLSLSSASGPTLGTVSSATLNINEDNDATTPTVYFSQSLYSVTEIANGTAPVTVNLSAASTQTVTVNFATSNGSA